MRLDKYLKVSRLIKRRTVANEACDAGSRNVKVEVLEVKDTVKKDEVESMFRYI